MLYVAGAEGTAGLNQRKYRLDQIEVEDFQGSDGQGGGHSDQEVRNAWGQ